MGSSQTSLNPERIDWDSEDTHALLNPRWSARELQNLADVAETGTRQRQLASHLWLATSGSTTESMAHIKLVALGKKAFQASAQSVNQHLQTSSRDVWLQILPRFHVGGLGVEVRAMLSNSKVVQDLGKWDPARIHSVLQSEKVSLTSMVPTQIFDLVQKQLRAPPALRAVVIGGGALTENLYLQAKALGWPLLPSYGLTETCSQIATASLESLANDRLPLAKKLSHVEWRLSPEGLLEVEGSSLLTCYGQRQAEGSVRAWDPKKDSWLTTEDFVVLQGHELRFIGRKNDFIKIGGEGSSMGRLREIFERVLATAAGEDAHALALVDAPSERLGTEVHLVAEQNLKPELAARVQEKFNQEVLPFERIRQVKYTQQIPRSDLGKVLWARLKKELYEH